MYKFYYLYSMKLIQRVQAWSLERRKGHESGGLIPSWELFTK